MTMQSPAKLKHRAAGAMGRSEFAIPIPIFVAHVTVVCDFQSTQRRDRRARAVQLIDQSKPRTVVLMPMMWGFEQVV